MSQPSGAQKRKVRKAKELLTGVDDKDFVEAARKLGAPPDDPIEAIVWGNRLAALVSWHASFGPLSLKAQARRRGALEGIKALGLTNAKAIDKKLMLRIAERLGLKAKDADGELEPVAEGAKALRA